MKKSKTAIVALVLALMMAIPTIVIAQPMDDIPQRTENGVVYVPLRQAAYAHGAAVEWNGVTRTVYITDADGNRQGVIVEAAGGFIEDGTSWIPLDFAAGLFPQAAAGLGIHGAIHRVEYGDNVAYLFGTIHGWLDGWSPLAYEVESALARADIFAWEVESLELEELQAATIEYGMFLPDAQSWADFLPQDAYEHFIEVMAEWGIDYNEETRYINPEFLILALRIDTALSLAESGFEIGAMSVDSYVMGIALERGLPIIGLEDVRQQLEILYHPPIEVVVHNIMNFLPPEDLAEEIINSDEPSLDELAGYYETNNLSGLSSAFSRPFDPENENVSQRYAREMVFNWRSTYYANRIAEMLQETEEPTTFFVAVGISHIIRSMAGEDFTDIVEQLRLMGFEVVPLFTYQR